MAKGFGSDPMMALRLPKEEQDRATRLAKAQGMSRSKLIRKLLANADRLLSMPQADQRQPAQR